MGMATSRTIGETAGTSTPAPTPLGAHPPRPVARSAQPTTGQPDYDLDAQDTYWGAVLGTLLGFGLALAGLFIGIGATGAAGETQAFWYLSRAAGLVAYLLLWGSMVWGLLLSSRILRKMARPPVLLDAHQYLSSLAIGFALFHGLVLLGDRYITFTVGQILVPFLGTYEPLAVALGQLTLWLSVLLIGSFYVRKWIGPKTWRRFHYVSFAAYLLALIHAILVGTDTQLPAIAIGYATTAATVLFLVSYRVLAGRTSRSTR